MFDIGASELLVIVIVAILVIGPSDMPKALKHAGRWIGKLRRMSSHFRAAAEAAIKRAAPVKAPEHADDPSPPPPGSSPLDPPPPGKDG